MCHIISDSVTQAKLLELNNLRGRCFTSQLHRKIKLQCSQLGTVLSLKEA